MTPARTRPATADLKFRSIFFIAFRDLSNEKLISACLIFCVAAVLTPLMLLASVKVGFIDRIRTEFIQDPTFREVRPASATLLPEDFIARMRGWSGVSYVMPSVMLVPRDVDFVVPRQSPFRGTARLVPSSPDDPLLKGLEGTPPRGDEVAVSADLARSAGLSLGSKVQLSVSRIENDQRRRVTVDCVVSGIVPEERVKQPTIFSTPAIDRQTESFRAGVAVTERGWPGAKKASGQSYEGIVVVARQPLGETALTNLKVRIGATALQAVTQKEVMTLTGTADFTPDQAGSAAKGERTYYAASKAGQSYSGADLDEARSVLSNFSVDVVGVNPPLTVTAYENRLAMRGVDPRLLANAAGAGAGWALATDAAYVQNDGVFLPESLKAKWQSSARYPLMDLTIPQPDGWATRGEMTIPVRVAGFTPDEAVIASPTLLGMLYRGKTMPLAFDKVGLNIVEQSAGYRGFRLVTEDLDSVPRVVARFEKEGFHVRAKSDEILKLQSLERSLNILIAVVGSVAVVGGLAILAASFFANVQRKRVDYATLRLIGMRKAEIFQIPITQAMIVGLCGFVLSAVLYFMVSAFLNGVIAQQLQFQGQLSKLYFSHFVFVAVFVLLGAGLASLAASREATRIDPSQAIRAG